MSYENISCHIVFGDSAAGSLNYFFNSIKNLQGQKIINISDDFSYGPLDKYDTKDGELERIKWIDQLLNITHENEETKKYFKERINIFKDKISNIEKNEKILIWYASNISDYIGLRYLSSVLQNNDNNIHAINVSETKIKANNSVYYKPISLGEVSPEDIDLLLPSCKLIKKPLWNTYQNSWIDIINDKHTLRILENNQIIFVDDTYYDSLIINECTSQYFKCARIIGQVLGKTDQLISDLIIDWRIRVLLEKKMIIGKGYFKTMRDFSIKRK